ncbi:MAG: S41 family peptidase [Bacteroidales bacterium]|nr:S41 family peptidase [Bacteroidales bacterium]
MKYYSLLLILIFLVSCEGLMFEDSKGSKDPEDNFEYLWRECDEKYSLFEVKNINWDSIHDIYSERIHPGLNDDQLFSILAEMLNELKDGHVNLVSYFNVSYFNIERLGSDNFDFRIIEDNYLSDNYYTTGPFKHDFIASGQVAYVRFSEFSGIVGDDNLDFILKRYQDTRGMIFDIRENGGGSPYDIYSFLARFVEEQTHVFNSRIKSGPGHREFSDPEPAYVYPSDSQKYTHPVILLTDRGSYSASSFFALACKALPNIVQVGDTTGGGLGLPNGGQLPNGWQYRFSITQALDLAGNNWETGVPPDITVIMSEQDRMRGIDPVIETAISLILLNEL